MKRQVIIQQIEIFLDDWDPIGILQDVKPIIYLEGAIGEYSKYVHTIIEVFLSNKSIYNYLIQLHTDLRDNPDEYMKEEIKLVAERMINYLSQYKTEDIYECLNCK